MRWMNSEEYSERSVGEINSVLEEGEDPRVAIAKLNRQIVDYQKAGEDVPPRLLRLSRALASECIAQSQGR